MQKFYVIGTPIGNLEDITLRALRILKEVDYVVAEDTRVTKKLLGRYDIKKPIISFHARSGESKMEEVFDLVREGKVLALVTDAGTPGISDPGSFLVSKLRENFPDLKIAPVPGASALTAAISVSGLDLKDFRFYGFLPHKKGREKIFSEIALSRKSSVFYESPHRIMKTLRFLADILSPEREIFLARELTKIFEETFSGSAKSACEYFEKNKEKQKGEFVLVTGPEKKKAESI
jgi:16S rRNA (cytidine1402-2'-O)-methyltransferase